MITDYPTIHAEVPAELLEPTRPKVTKEQQLLNEVEGVFRKFMAMPSEHAFTVATLWVAHTHLRSTEGHFLPRTTPRLYYGSKQAGCGKTMAMELTTLMCFNGEVVIEPTEPGLISKIHNDHATVGLDEIDLFFGNRGGSKSGHRAVINGGYKRGTTVDRERNDETEKRNIHAPMVLAGKNANRFMTADAFETLRTRSIAVLLERKPVGTELAKYRSDRHEGHLRSIAARLARWGQHFGKRITCLDVEPLLDALGIDNRDAEVWNPLFQLAAHVGGDWLDRIEAAAKALTLGDWGPDETPVLSPAEDLLKAAADAFGDDEDFLSTSELLRRLLTAEGSWWTEEWSTPRAAAMDLATTLGTFGIEASRGYVDGKQARGYALSALQAAPDDEDEDWGAESAAPAEWDWSGIDD
jgi:hypothetical protein